MCHRAAEVYCGQSTMSIFLNYPPFNPLIGYKHSTRPDGTRGKIVDKIDDLEILGIHIVSGMRMKNSAGEECVKKLLRSREGFHRVCSYNDSPSEYAPLIGWYFRLIRVLASDWLKCRRGRWFANINYFWGFAYPKPFVFALPLHSLWKILNSIFSS